VVIVGDVLHSRVALSIYALKMQGAEVKVCGPKHLYQDILNLLA
jgi:aspartate carbamoyltransferase catalytic subunit